MILIKPYPIVRSIGSFVVPKSILYRSGSGGTFNSAYCYSVWLRHLSCLQNFGLVNNIDKIKSVAEIGPGDSLGIGLASVYTGAENYYAFDVIEHTSIEKNLKINQELLELFLVNSVIPHGEGFENTSPILENYSYPVLLESLNADYFKERKTFIDEALKRKNDKINISYVVPWYDTSKSDIENIDLIFSQAVMEHVDNIELAYSKMFKWLKKGGIISHQIDFKAHEMTEHWSGHWYISEPIWKFLLKGRKYPINRLPLSTHLNVIEKTGFEIKKIVPVKRDNKYASKKTKVKGYNFTKEDLVTSGALVVAVKP